MTSRLRFKRSAQSVALAALTPILLAVCAPPAGAQFDAEVMQKWMSVTVIHYAVTGEFAADTLIVNAGTSGLAEVKDRVEISFDWDQTEAKLVGTPVITNFDTQHGALRNGAEGCTPPTLHGAYEHFTLLAMTDGLGGQSDLSVRRDTPAADMPQVCTGAPEAVPAKSTTETLYFTVPGVMILAMPIEPGGALTVAADRQSMVFVDKGWTWTYRPTPLR